MISIGTLLIGAFCLTSVRAQKDESSVAQPQMVTYPKIEDPNGLQWEVDQQILSMPYALWIPNQIKPQSGCPTGYNVTQLSNGKKTCQIEAGESWLKTFIRKGWIQNPPPSYEYSIFASFSKEGQPPIIWTQDTSATQLQGEPAVVPLLLKPQRNQCPPKVYILSQRTTNDSSKICVLVPSKIKEAFDYFYPEGARKSPIVTSISVPNVKTRQPILPQTKP